MTVRPLIAGLCSLIFCAQVCLAMLDLTVVNSRHQPQDLNAVIAELAEKRVIFIGETHDRYEQHLNQLEIILRLHDRDPMRWAIGLECFQRQFQAYLDAYVAGKLSEDELLKKTEYSQRWGYDFRLYRPVIQYARSQRIPLVALNAESELTNAVGESGLDGISSADRARLPMEIDESDSAYRNRVHEVYEKHPPDSRGEFEHFWQAQLVWDETMAERVADYLTGHPDKGMIVLAGSGHIAFGSGIPSRVKRRIPGIESAILLSAEKADADSQGADYLLISPSLKLSPLHGKEN